MKNNFFVKDSKILNFIVTYAGLKLIIWKSLLPFFIRDYDTYIKFKLKELSLCNKSQFSYTYISTTKLCKLLIFQTLIV